MFKIIKRIFALSLCFVFLIGTTSSFAYTHNRWDYKYGGGNGAYYSSLNDHDSTSTFTIKDNGDRWKSLNRPNQWTESTAQFTQNTNGNLTVEERFSDYCHSLIPTARTTFSVDTTNGSIASVSAPADNFYASWTVSGSHSLNLPSEFRGSNWKWWKVSNTTSKNKLDKTKIRVKISNLRIYTKIKDNNGILVWKWVDVDCYREVTYSLLAPAERLSNKPTNNSGQRNSTRWIALGKGLCDTIYIGAEEVETINSFYLASKPLTDENKVHIYTNITLKDIDTQQYCMFWKDRTVRQYVTSNTLLSWIQPRQTYSFNTTERINPEYNQLNNYWANFGEMDNDPRTTVSFLFDGDEIEYRFGRKYSSSQSVTMQEQYLGSGQDNFTFVVPNPNKTITDDDEIEVSSNKVRDVTQEWTYNVIQPIPDNQDRTAFSNFELSDEIDKCLKVKDVSIEGTNGNTTSNVDNWFDLTTITLENGKTKVLAKAKSSIIIPATASFYNNLSYTLKIKVGINFPNNKTRDEVEEDLENDEHFSNDRTYLSFKNQASSNINNINRNTEEVTTTVHLSKKTTNNAGLKIVKSADKFEYQVNDKIHYTVEVDNVNPEADFCYFTIKDVTLPSNVSLVRSSISVSGINSSNYTLTSTGNTWQIVSNGDYAQPYGTPIKIEYDAIALKPSNSHLVDNTATAFAFGVGEHTAEAEVWVNSPKLNIVKKADKTNFNLGDTINYTIEVTNINEGTLAYLLLEDAFPYSGFIKSSTIKVMGDNTDITNDCDIFIQDGTKIKIDTRHYLKNSDCELSQMNDFRRRMGYINGTVPRCHNKITITYQVKIPDCDVNDNQAILLTDNKTLTNNVTASSHSTYNHLDEDSGEYIYDPIKEDVNIPSGGDEDEYTLTINNPQLSIKKESNKEAYKVDKIGTYTLIVKQPKSNLIARNVIIQDFFNNDSLSGITLITNSIKVYLNGLDITSTSLISTGNGSFNIITNKSITDQDEIKVQYDIKFNKTGYFSNMSSVDADNTDPAYDYNQVEVQVNGLPMTGSERNLLLTFIGLGILILISFLVIRRKRKLIKNKNN